MLRPVPRGYTPRPSATTLGPPRWPLGRCGFVQSGHGHRHRRGAKRGQEPLLLRVKRMPHQGRRRRRDGFEGYYGNAPFDLGAARGPSLSLPTGRRRAILTIYSLREQEVPDSPYAPQGWPGGFVRPDLREAPLPRVAPAQDARPHQAPGGGQPTQRNATGGTPPDTKAPKEQPGVVPHDSNQPIRRAPAD